MLAGYAHGGGGASEIASALRFGRVTPACPEAWCPGWPLTCAMHPTQAPTPVSMLASASTLWAPLSASVCRATPARAARSTSTSASPARVRMTPPAWTRSASSSASACLVPAAKPLTCSHRGEQGNPTKAAPSYTFPPGHQACKAPPRVGLALGGWAGPGVLGELWESR